MKLLILIIVATGFLFGYLDVTEKGHDLISKIKNYFNKTGKVD